MPVAELARRSGVDRGSLYRYMNGAGWSRKTLRAIASSFGVSDSEFLAGPTSIDDPREVHVAELPYFEAVPAGGIDTADETGETYPVLRHRAKAGRVVVKVAGQSMYPTIWDGDLVLVDTAQQTPRSGSIVVARANGGWTLKRIRRTRSLWFLTGDNPQVPPIEVEEDLEVLGAVLGIVWRDTTLAVV